MFDVHLEIQSSTLLIPLMGRAYAQKVLPQSPFQDEISRKWAEQLRTDPTPFLKDRAGVWGTIQRTLAFDDITRDFIGRFPEGQVLNLGCGLCTRFLRLDNGRLRWIEFDTPEVLTLRRKFCKPQERYIWISMQMGENKNLNGSEYLDSLEARPTLVLAEGVLMFLEQKTVKEVFTRVFQERNLYPTEMVFDYLHSSVKDRKWLQPRSFRHIGAKYIWGVTSLREELKSIENIEWITEHALTSRFPFILRNLSQITQILWNSPLYDIAWCRKRSLFQMKQCNPVKVLKNFSNLPRNNGKFKNLKMNLRLNKIL